MTQTRERRTKATLLTFLAFLLGALIISFRMTQPYLLTVVMGGILALISYPVFKRLTAKGWRPKLASLGITLGILAVIVVPLGFFAVQMIKQGIALGQELIGGQHRSVGDIIHSVVTAEPLRRFISDPAAVERQAWSTLQGAAKGLSAAALGVAANIPKLILQIALTLIACYFLILDGKKFLNWLFVRIPMDADVRSKLLESLHNTSVSVILATLAAASVQALVMLMAYLVLGVPGAFLAAGATFILAWIPMVGSTPVWIVGTLIVYSAGSLPKAALMLGFGIFTGVIDNFVRPLVLKGRNSMHPLTSLVAIFGGIEMFGLLGVFIGPILIALLSSLLQIWPSVEERYGMTSSQDREKVA